MENIDPTHCDVCAKSYDPDLLENAPVDKNYKRRDKRTKLDEAESKLRILHGQCVEHGVTPRPKGDCIRCIVETVADALDIDRN